MVVSQVFVCRVIGETEFQGTDFEFWVEKKLSEAPIYLFSGASQFMEMK